MKLSAVILFQSVLLQVIAAEWQTVHTAHAPTARASVSTATTDAGVLLFGGTDGESSSDFKNDTWLFDGSDWLLQETATAPPPRAIGQLASFGKGAVLFGGLSGLGTFLALNDTWMWSAEDGWRELHLPLAPPARAYHNMVATEHGVVLFGGRTFHLDVYEESFNDVWLFDGSSWTELTYSAKAPRPAARYAASFAPVSGGVLLFGGAGATENDHLGDSWLLKVNGSSLSDFEWQQLENFPSPRGRWCQSAVQCGDGALIMGGSFDYRMFSDETWRWTPEVISSVWGQEHNSVGRWEKVGNSQWTNSGYGAVPYTLGNHTGVLMFTGAGNDNVAEPLGMGMNNVTRFWSCSSRKY